jgi:hypothetical protein
VGDRLTGGDAHPQPGEQPRPDVDRHAADLAQVDPGLLAEEVDRRGQRLGVALGPAAVDRRQHALVPADGAADLHGRRGDAEDEHQGPTSL